jgi:hypothetical protein
MEPNPSTGQDSSDGVKDALDLYKLEYQVAATRYDNIYRSAWTIFSYMALVAGGILTFGGTRFTPSFTAFLAGVPLLFWFFSSYLPLNRYGELTLTRLQSIESELNNRFRVSLGHFSSFKTDRPWYRRARTVIHAVFWPLFLFITWGVYHFTAGNGQILAPPPAAPTVRVEVPATSPASLHLSTDELIRLLQPLDVQIRSRNTAIQSTAATPQGPTKK